MVVTMHSHWFGLFLLLAVLYTPGQAGVMNFCGFHLGAIHRGTISLNGANMYRSVEGVRSKTECATYCYDDSYCRTAVYQTDGDCLFIGNFTADLSLVSDESFSPLTDYILEMKSADAAVARQTGEEATCSSPCTGNTVCLMDCSNNTGIDEPMCMDITTSQYEVDGCDFEPYIQSKEYYLSNLDREVTSDTTFFTVTFVKLRQSSSLRVKWRGTLMSTHHYVRWQILFNGGNCGNPNWIESTIYNAESDTRHHKATGIHGVCHGLSAGSISISLYGDVDSATVRVGYATQASRLYVEELGQGDWTDRTSESCPSLPVFNLRQHYTTTEWSQDHSTTLWSVAYKKMEENTMLRINVDFNMRLHTAGSNAEICVTWYVYIDGGNCSPTPMGNTVANLANANSVSNEHRSGEVEGHCSGISAGDHTISLYVHTCPWSTASGDVHTGWSSCRQRFMIEEYHTGSNIAAVMASDGKTLYRVPQFNMVNHGLANPSYGGDTEPVWIIPNYIKTYSASGLQLTLSANGRCYWGHGDSTNYSPCCRHYFVINDAECDSPGTIEGIHALNKNTNLYRPIMIEGICEGIPAGTVTLTLNAGICRSYPRKGECYFGWNSYVHLLISESFVDREIIEF